MWTHAERTFIQSMLKEEIPMALITKILMINRPDPAPLWKKFKAAHFIVQLFAHWKNVQKRFILSFTDDDVIWFLRSRGPFFRAQDRRIGLYYLREPIRGNAPHNAIPLEIAGWHFAYPAV